MCDMLTDQNYAAVESALMEGTMPKDSHSILLDYYDVLSQNEDVYKRQVIKESANGKKEFP